MPKRLSLLLLSTLLFFTSACSDEAQLAEQCETQSSCETTTETKTNWASAGGIGAGVLALGALAGGGLSGGSDGGGGSSSNNSNSNGDSNDSGATTATLLTGRLLDSAVAGVTYNTTSNQSGTTTTEGEYNYREGDQITFSIGGLQLGPINATALITPLELTGASTTADQRVLNLIRLLQTLDSDQDPANGLFISSTFRNSLQGRSFNFEQSPSVFQAETNTTLQSAGIARGLVDGQGALDHFHSTLQREGRDNQIGDSNTLLSLLASDSSCFFDGVELQNNTSVQAYESSSVPFGEGCQVQSRTCQDGKLSGTYAFSACTVDAASSCSFNGVTVAHGDNIQAFQTTNVPINMECQSQVRTCDDGVLSGTFAFSNCQISEGRSCSFNGQTVSHDDRVKAFASESVAYGLRCQAEDRMCEDGILSGSYEHASCSIQPFSTITMKATTEVCDDVCDGLVVHLPFSGSAENTAESDVSARIFGATFTEDKDQKPESALSFDGDDYILLEGLEQLNLESGDFSFSYVAKLPSNKILNSKLFSILGVDNNISKDQESLSVVFFPYGDFSAPSNVSIDNNNLYSVNEYFHIAMTFNRNEGLIRQYFNGELLGIGRVNNHSFTKNNYNVIGLNNNQLFYGILDDFRIYNRELTTNEVRDLVGISEIEILDEVEFENKVIQKETAQICDDVCNGLVMYYPFKNTADDFSSNGLHSTFYGAEFTKDRNQISQSAAYFNSENFIYINGLDNSYFDDAISIVITMAFDENKMIPFRSHKIIQLDSFNPAIQPIGIHLAKFTGDEIPHIAFYGDNFNPVYRFENSELRKYFHFVGVLSKSDGISKLFIDGELKGQSPFFGDFQIDQMFIGGGMGRPGLNGVIDEFRLYNRALSESEIQQIIGN